MNYYVKCFQNYVNFSGRARRMEYWMFFLFNMIISYGLTGLAIAVDMPMLATLSLIYSLATLLPSIAVGVRRMHDTGNSGWFLLIPIYNIILAFTDSEQGGNKWGPNPKTSEGDDVTFDFEKEQQLPQ